MKTKIFSFFLFMLLPGVIFAGEAKILSMSGTVEARQTREGQWASASDNMEIAEGGAVRTGADGAAVLLLPNKTKIWMKETSSLEIEQRQTLASRLALVFGKIKVRVPHLMRKEKFEVRTPAAVCAVRGTEFTMNTTEDGKMDLQVLFGEVKLKFNIPPAKGASEFSIPQGQGLSTPEEGKAAKPALLTAAAERSALENWNPGLKPEERQKEMKQKENDRAQVREFARATNNTENAVKGFLNVVKESDLEAGRTLTDVHGNLVRVDQRLMRPDGQTLQFFNLVKRPTYADYAKASGGFKYNGGAVTERLDMLQMNIHFDKEIPQRIEEWPGFFDKNSVNSDWFSFVAANRTYGSDIFFVAQNYVYDPTRDTLVNNPWVLRDQSVPVNYIGATNPDDRQVILAGMLQDTTGTGGDTAIAKLDAISKVKNVRDDSQYTAGGGSLSDGALKYLASDGTWKQLDISEAVWAIKVPSDVNNLTYTSAHPYYELKGGTGDNAPLWQYQADLYDVGANGLDYFWFAKETYGIDNGGKIVTVGDITNSSTDPFTLLRTHAAQTALYIKDSNKAFLGSTPVSINDNDAAYTDIKDSDYFKGGTMTSSNKWTSGTNIDLVMIPDLAIAAVQRMLPAITALNE